MLVGLNERMVASFQSGNQLRIDDQAENSSREAKLFLQNHTLAPFSAEQCLRSFAQNLARLPNSPCVNDVDVAFPDHTNGGFEHLGLIAEGIRVPRKYVNTPSLRYDHQSHAYVCAPARFQAKK